MMDGCIINYCYIPSAANAVDVCYDEVLGILASETKQGPVVNGLVLNSDSLNIIYTVSTKNGPPKHKGVIFKILGKHQ